MKVNELQKRIPFWTDALEKDYVRPYANFLGIFADQLHTTPPYGITLVSLFSHKFNIRERNRLPLIAIGHFRLPYTAIERIARVLTYPILQTGVVPSIQPIPQRHIEKLTDNDPFVYKLSERGAVLFVQGEDSSE